MSNHVSRRFTEENWEVLEEVRAIADAHDATPAQVSLAWLLEQEVVTAPIIGPKSSEQLQENLGALELELSDEELERIAAPKTPTWPAQ